MSEQNEKNSLWQIPPVYQINSLAMFFSPDDTHSLALQ